MNELDWVLLGLVAASTILGMVRGMTKEIIGLAAWVLGLWLAFRYASWAANYFPRSMPEVTRDIAGFASVLILSLIGVGLIGRGIRALLGAAQLGFEDFFLGALFGAVRGVVIVAVLVLVAGSLNVVKDTTYWRQSSVVPMIEKGLRQSADFLPHWVVRLRDDWQTNVSKHLPGSSS